MADVIERANEIRVTNLGDGMWHAEIGPRLRGLSTIGPSAAITVCSLMALCACVGWPWDESWTDPHPLPSASN